ncbi:hypothetical protein [Acidisoma sp. 7E03]
MARSRSPNYPQVGLREAVQRVKSVYDSDYRSLLTRALTAERLGYSGVNGKSLAVMAALGKFGLLEGKGDALRVSERAVRIIAHPPGAAERVAALEEAAVAPGLFQQLAQRFPGRGASDGTLRAFLLTQRFIPPAAEAALRAWRETQQMIAEEREMGEAAPAAVAPRAPAPGVTPVATGESGLRRAVFGLAEGEVTITAPVFLSAASVNDLQDYLDVFMKRARREAGLD